MINMYKVFFIFLFIMNIGLIHTMDYPFEEDLGYNNSQEDAQNDFCEEDDRPKFLGFVPCKKNPGPLSAGVWTPNETGTHWINSAEEMAAIDSAGIQFEEKEAFERLAPYMDIKKNELPSGKIFKGLPCLYDLAGKGFFIVNGKVVSMKKIVSNDYCKLYQYK